jgi:Ca2+/Na+ antiporter
MSTDQNTEHEQRRLEHLKEMSAYAAEDARRVHLRVTAALALAVLYLTQLPFKNLVALDAGFRWCLIAGILLLLAAALFYFDYASRAHEARTRIAAAIRDGEQCDYAKWWNESAEGVWQSKQSAFHLGNALFVLATLALGVVLAALLRLI